MIVGVLGGGQLGRMLALTGYPLGLRFRFLDPARDACARGVGPLHVGAFDDAERLERLARGAAVVTYEFENVPVSAAERLAGRVPVYPPPAALAVAQDRLEEKTLFRRLGIPTGRHGGEVSGRALVKSRRHGYDGKGQRIADAAEAGPDELAEEILAFDRELAQIAVRGRDGELAFYPLVETVHEEGILRVARAPADGPAEEAREYARRILEELDYVGVLALELFDVGGRLLANELAPRVHNSGHLTIEAAATSQFENHLRAILGWPLGSTEVARPAAMVNLIGEPPATADLLRVPRAHVHLYGKQPRPGRKVGHVTLLDPSEDELDALRALAGRGASARRRRGR